MFNMYVWILLKKCYTISRSFRSFNISGTCPDNWIHVQGSCYKFSSESLTWTAAKSACEALGSRLVVIHTQAKQEALAANVQVHPQRAWIGLYRDPSDKSRWLWVDGSRPTYTNWSPGEPNNAREDEECGQMYPQSWGYKWNDGECYYYYPYICEINGK